MITVKEQLENEGCAYIAAVSKRLGAIYSKVQPSECWVGGDEGGFTNDSNYFFDNAQQAQDYYNREYTELHVFDNEAEAQEKVDELEMIYG